MPNIDDEDPQPRRRFEAARWFSMATTVIASILGFVVALTTTREALGISLSSALGIGVVVFVVFAGLVALIGALTDRS